MSSAFLSQQEADALLVMSKHRVSDEAYEYPGLSGSIVIPLRSDDRREEFLLDIHRSRVDVAKGTYGNRARVSIVLASLHFGYRPHTNPDGVEISSPHMHVYREGYGIKFAYSLDPTLFPNPDDRWQLLHDFMRFVHITTAPEIVRGFFV
jgi:hypothetical protein